MAKTTFRPRMIASSSSASTLKKDQGRIIIPDSAKESPRKVRSSPSVRVAATKPAS